MHFYCPVIKWNPLKKSSFRDMYHPKFTTLPKNAIKKIAFCAGILALSCQKMYGIQDLFQSLILSN